MGAVGIDSGWGRFYPYVVAKWLGVVAMAGRCGRSCFLVTCLVENTPQGTFITAVMAGFSGIAMELGRYCLIASATVF